MTTTIKRDNSRILIIPDLHIPYHHPEAFDFLKAIKKEYKPTSVICLGDECDKHSLSFHSSDPDLPNAGDELIESIKHLKVLYKMFPQVDLVDSNHGSMIYRKAKFHGIPVKYVREYNEILEAPVGWKWHNNIFTKLPNGQLLYVTHGVRKDGIKLAQAMGCNVVQGHFHSEFNIKYASSPNQLYWSMQAGCLIDDKSLAFHYNKTTAIRPIIGAGMVIEGQPLLIPMILSKSGIWNKEII